MKGRSEVEWGRTRYLRASEGRILCPYYQEEREASECEGCPSCVRRVFLRRGGLLEGQVTCEGERARALVLRFSAEVPWYRDRPRAVYSV